VKLDAPRLDSDKAFNKLVEYGEDWADKDAAASLLEEAKKSILSELKLASSDLTSEAKKETTALASEPYRKHLELMVEARRVANRARVKYDSAKVLAEMRRSEESTRRAEMTLR
jgi:hypothetical protein